MPVFQLSSALQFPDPERSDADGLLAVGGDLRPERLLLAYTQGIFPWFGEDSPILWWSPLKRAIFLPGDEHFSRRTLRALRSRGFEIRWDTRFPEVVRLCAEVPRPGQDGTWITPEMVQAYTELHQLGHAHSVEAYREGRLVGGLYGVIVGAAFCGESMFSLEDYASRAAFQALCERLWTRGFHIIDGQMPNENLASLGARIINRREYLDRLGEARRQTGPSL
ncbi:MAG: aat [Holophagaceae bacterium]|nr:aat [Holophagaceae bacterium]